MIPRQLVARRAETTVQHERQMTKDSLPILVTPASAAGDVPLVDTALWLTER